MPLYNIYVVYTGERECLYNSWPLPWSGDYSVRSEHAWLLSLPRGDRYAIRIERADYGA